MTHSDVENHQPEHASEIQKTVRLCDYLLKLAGLRTKLIRNISEYEKVLWIFSIPHERGCFAQAWGRDEEHDSDEWLEVETKREPELPSVPSPCKDWVNPETLRNKDDSPELLPKITRQIQNPDWSEGSDEPETIAHTERLEDHPEVQQVWDRYLEGKWLPWAEEHNKWEKVHKIYAELFAIYQAQLRLGEEYELVIGLGLLTWQTPANQRVRRHVVVADAVLEFEARLGKFTLRPHTDGAKLRPELDMLDIEEQPIHAEEIAKEGLTAAADNPWGKGCVETVLQSLVHSISSQGDYDDSLETKNVHASAKPVIEYAPALILRKRSTKGLSEVLKRIKEQIEKGETIPSEFADLAEIDTKSDRELTDEPNNRNATFDGEIFFPKPSNEEQRRIVDKMRATSGVLVQGPPGTGKSHTIANLICHLLATGQRTLITAKTPRALQVLKELVPKELRPLCINLLGSGFEERSSLESSVNGILRKHEEWNEDDARLERKKLDRQLLKLREEQVQVNRQLRDIRESETHTKSIADGTYRGTAARIAETVNRDRNTYEWLMDNIPLDEACAITTGDLNEILEELRYFTAEKREKLSLVWPETLPSSVTLPSNEHFTNPQTFLMLRSKPVVLPTSEHFTDLFQREARTIENYHSLIGEADERIASHMSTSKASNIENIRNALIALQHERKRLLTLSKKWIKEAVSDVCKGDYSLWNDLSAIHISEHDFRNILSYLRHYTPERREQFRSLCTIPFPSHDEILNIFNHEKKIIEEENLCLKRGADEFISNQLLSYFYGAYRQSLEYQNYETSETQEENSIFAMQGLLHKIRASFRKLSTFKSEWIENAKHDVIGGNSELWRDRYHITKQKIISIEKLISTVNDIALDLPASNNIKILLNHAVKLKEYVRDGGKLGWWLFRSNYIKNSLHVIKTIRINGTPCSTLTDFSILTDVLRVHSELEDVWLNWSGILDKVEGDYTRQVIMLKSLCDALENVFLLEESFDKCRAITRFSPALNELNWPDESHLEILITSCSLASVRQRKRIALNNLTCLKSTLNDYTFIVDSESLTDILSNAINDRKPEEFLRNLPELEQKLKRIVEMEGSLAEIDRRFPKLATEIERTCDSHSWDTRFQCIADSELQRVLSLSNLIESVKQASLDIAGIEKLNWNSESELNVYIASCSLALLRQEMSVISNDIRDIENAISPLAVVNNLHPLTKDLLSAIHERNLDGVMDIMHKIQTLDEECQRFQKANKSLLQLRSVLPYLTDELEQSCNEPYWDKRFQRIGAAWHWAQARYWLEEYIRQENIPTLEKRVKQIEDEINAMVAKLASLSAWSFCFSRLKEDHRRHMEAWQQSMRKLGKGTGKHAPRHRREAQEHLNACREAVPAWVMPLHRVWDTVDPASGMFDVIIVDEASQCGFEAFPLFYLGKKIIIVGDDKQISPEAVGLPRDVVHRLIEEFLHDFQFKSSFDIESSLFDHGKLRYGTQRVTLREHFRCMPEIIRFSNDLCYSDTPLIPLRQYGLNRLPPLEHVFVNGGYREGQGNRTINRPEAEAIVERISRMCDDRKYDGKSMGVVVLQGEAQAALIESQLLEKLGAAEIERRRLVCGNPYSFQGDERDIMFLSLVAASNERIGPFTKAADERRFNVAASRARDMMILFHSITCDDLSDTDLRRRLLDFFQNTRPQQIAGIKRDELERRAAQDNRHVVNPPAPFESWFEVDVALELLRKGFTVLSQYEVAGKRIDLVVEGGKARLAVECDGDHWHGPDKYESDMQRQRQLERCGWGFFRVRESAFYTNKEDALAGLWGMLEERGISSNSQRADLSRVDLEENSWRASDVGADAEVEEVDNEENDSLDGVESAFIPSDRRAEEVTAEEIREAILQTLSKCPNHSCTLQSITARVLKEVGVLTRGKPREAFQRRTMRCVSTLEKDGRIETYKATNRRLRLIPTRNSLPLTAISRKDHG